MNILYFLSLAMDAFRANFRELFDHVIGYLHPIDLVALSLAAHRYADCYPSGFSQWRRCINGVNGSMSKIIHVVYPCTYAIRSDPTISVLIYYNKSAKYAYTSDNNGMYLRVKCMDKMRTYIKITRIYDNGKIEFTFFFGN